jgi:hypothetical protein
MSGIDPKATRASLPTTPSVQRMMSLPRRMLLSGARFSFRKKIERSPPIGHVGPDLALRRAAECQGLVGHGVNDACGRSRRVGPHHGMASIGIADVFERPRVIVPLQTATHDFRELE